MLRLSFERKKELLKQGSWTKCALETCSNPSYYNQRKNGCCSRSCSIKLYRPLIVERSKAFRKAHPEHRLKISQGLRRKSLMMSRIRKRLFIVRPDIQSNMMRMWKQTQLRENKPEWIEKALYDFERGRNDKARRVLNLLYTAKKGTSFGSNQFLCRSQFDYEICQKLDENPTIKSWKFLEDVIWYNKPNVTWRRIYWIDFEIEYLSGEKKLLFARKKGLKQRDLPILDVISKYATENNFKFEIWTDETVNPIS